MRNKRQPFISRRMSAEAGSKVRMKNYFLAEQLKYRHTAFTGLTVLMPVLCVFLSAWLTYNYFAVDSYNWWYMTLYPATIGIGCGMIGKKDMQKKNHTIRSLPCSMVKIWDAKVLTGILFSGASMACITVLIMIVGKAMEHTLKITFLLRPSAAAQAAAGLIIWLTGLWQIPFCLLLSQKTGSLLVVLIHTAGYMIQAAMLSLKPYFAVFPGAITSRLMCPVLGVLPNGLPAAEGQMTYSPGLMQPENLFIGILAAVFWLVLLWVLGRKWFERQVTL